MIPVSCAANGAWFARKGIRKDSIADLRRPPAMLCFHHREKPHGIQRVRAGGRGVWPAS